MTDPAKAHAETYQTIIPSLVVKDAIKAIDFYKRVLGAEERVCIAGPNGKILHAELKLGSSIFYIFDEDPRIEHVKLPQTLLGYPGLLHLYVENADSIFEQAIAAGATVSRPMSDHLWGGRYGSFIDPFGYHWGIGTPKEPLGAREMEKRVQEYFAHIAPMRWELTHVGIMEARTPEDVEHAMNRKGTLMVVVNSMCGCAAGRMRPGVREAIRNGLKPDHMITVFAGQDREATEAARRYFRGYPPSSPSIALLRDGEVVYMMPRSEIEVTDPRAIAGRLKEAFEKHCTVPATKSI